MTNEEYDAQRAAEQVAAAAKAAAFRVTAAAIARALLPLDGSRVWQLAPRKVHDMGERSPELRHGDEVIDLSIDGYGRQGRISISGSFPRLPDGGGLSSRVYEGTGYGSITVASDKLPANIARDIVRRFLPGYRAAMTAARAAIAQQQTREATTIATFDTLIAAGAGFLVASHDSIGSRRANLGDRELRGYIHDQAGVRYGDVRVSGDSVTIERMSMTPACAARVIAAIGTCGKGGAQ